MTEQEREELIEKMMTALIRARLNGFNTENTARAALAIAEPVIREDCAKIAEREANPDFETSDFLDGIAFGARVIAAAIQEGEKGDGKNN